MLYRSSSADRFPAAGEMAVAAVLAAGGLFGYYQAGSTTFACGKAYAGPEIRYWLAACALQALLFCLTGARAGALYRLSQYALLPLVGVTLLQLALAYPGIFLWSGAVATAYWFGRHVLSLLGRPLRAPDGLGAAIVETVLVLLAAGVIHTGLAFVFVHWPGVVLGGGLFLALACVSLLAAAFVVRREAPPGRFSIADAPPLALLLMVLLRAKFPDTAFDTLFYKATVPITIADWGTALTGVFDHTLLGTNFAEILVAQLRMLDPSYPPALTSTLSFLALWTLAPVAMRHLFAAAGPAGTLGVRAGVLLVVSLSEPHLAAGTTYHEPLMGLLMVAALLPMSAAWLFLSAAIATKFSVLFIVPVLVMARVAASHAVMASPSAGAVSWQERGYAGLRQLREGLPGPPRLDKVVAGLCVALAVLVIGEQFARNFAHTGRILGVTETLAGLTDPGGRVLASPPPANPAGALSPLDRYGKTLVHILTLDRWIVPTESGFHIIPSSRSNAVAVALAFCFLVFGALRARRRLLALLLTWCACAFALVSFVSQGRHLYPISFAAAVAIAVVIGHLAASSASSGRRRLTMLLSVATAIAAFGDQVVGTLMHNGWDCRRNLLLPVERTHYEGPRNELEKRLAAIVAQHRQAVPRGAVIPSIVCEHATDRKPYLGTHHIFAIMSSEYTPRYLKPDPARARDLPYAILALCFQNQYFVDFMIPASVRHEFEEVPGGDGVRILVSKRLAGGATPRSLLGGHRREAVPPQADWNFVAEWDKGLLPPGSRADTPSGRGAFAGSVDGAKAGILLSPFRLAFEDVEFVGRGTLEVEASVMYPQSDGMAVVVEMRTRQGERHTETLTLQPHAAPGERWSTVRIPVPASMKGPGAVSFTAASPSGNDSADWAAVRKATLRP